MTDRPLVFVDTETTCLGYHARPWEIAVIRREPDGTETESVFQVSYGIHNLPAGTEPMALHIGGWLLRGAPCSDYLEELAEAEDVAVFKNSEEPIAKAVHDLLRDQPVLVGVGVHFDAAVLGRMFRRHNLPDEPWHYAILDLKAASWGSVNSCLAGGFVTPPLTEAVRLPLSSERLAAACGVAPPTKEERHTALGDARWAERWYDALIPVLPEASR